MLIDWESIHILYDVTINKNDAIISTFQPFVSVLFPRRIRDIMNMAEIGGEAPVQTSDAYNELSTIAFVELSNISTVLKRNILRAFPPASSIIAS